MFKNFIAARKKVAPLREHDDHDQDRKSPRGKQTKYSVYSIPESYAGSVRESEYSNDSEEERLRKAAEKEILIQLHQAEEEARRKTKSTLEFEQELLREGSLETLAVKSKNDIESTSAEKKRAKKGSLKTKVATYLVTAIAWWDLVMVLLTFLHIESINIALESVFRDNYYDFCTDFKAYGSHIIWIQTIHGLACLGLLYSFSKGMADLMVLWLASKVAVLMYWGYRESHGLRLRAPNKESLPRNVGVLVGVGIFYCLEIIAVVILYFDIKKPYNQRRLHLQSTKPLNRDIYLKSLSPFMQRKCAVRWAEKLQAIYVMQRLREREMKQDKKKRSSSPLIDLTDDELALRVATGLKEYKTAHDYSFSQIQSAESFTTRKTHPYYKSMRRPRH